MPATATKRTGYRDLRSVVKQPLADRKPMAIGRNGEKVIPRNFDILPKLMKKLKDAHAAGDKFPIPQNKGSYFYILLSLKELGLNKRHSWGVFVAKIRELMSDKSTVEEDDKGHKTTAWQRFRDKGPATDNEDNARDVEGRILQNCEVLQRVNIKTSNNPYGLKLLQVGQKILGTVGATLDITLDEAGKPMVMLNTNSDTPKNELRRGRGKKPAKAAKAAKPAKAKKAAKKAAPAKLAAKPKAEKKAAKPRKTTVKAEKAPVAEQAPEAPEVKADEPAGEIAEAV